MAYSATITERIAIGGTTSSEVNVLTANGRAGFTETVAGSATDYQVNISIDVSEVKAFFLTSEEDMTVETNDSVAPDNTINLKAGIPYIFYTNKYDSFLLTIDVTKVYLTNGSANASVVRCEVVYDPTP